jgi:hypothetical protein
LPYFTLTPTFSICPKHGYLSGEHKFCPKCDEEAGYREIAADVPAEALAKAGEMAVHPSGLEIPVKPVEEQLIPEAASANQSGNERNIINAIA